jgi:hypothetical protein
MIAKLRCHCARRRHTQRRGSPLVGGACTGDQRRALESSGGIGYLEASEHLIAGGLVAWVHELYFDEDWPPSFTRVTDTPSVISVKTRRGAPDQSECDFSKIVV